jgi:transcriptional regulator with XRE-family HTH domain
MCKPGKSIYFLSRLQANLSRNEAAEKLNISMETIGAYERGETKIPCSLVPRMAVLYRDELLPYKHISNCPVGCECLPKARKEVSTLVRIGIEYLISGQKKIGLRGNANRPTRVTPA